MIQIIKKYISPDFLKTPFLLFLLLATGLITFPSCVTTTAVNKRPEATIYKSNNYVIYKLQDSETPKYLAEKFLGDKNKSWIIKEANPEKTFSAGHFIIIPLKEKNKGGLSINGYQVVPVIVYHRFSDKCSSELCMPTHIFEQQMKYIKENGYHAITPKDLLGFLEYRQALPKKSIMITIDDGFRSAYNIAYPILKKYGFTATLFIYTNYVGVSSSAITWDELREMKANGFSIGSHTISHCDLTAKLKGESEQDYLARIKKELKGSKEILDRELGQNTIIIAYPYGNYDQRVVQYSKEAGYKMAMSVKRGENAFFSNPMTLKRDEILHEGMQLFHSDIVTFKQLSLQ